ncbi:MAG: DNA-methyltransferase [Candidatus Methylomirabilia bacterium]
MVCYQSADGTGVLLVGDCRAMPMIADRSVSVILTSPPYWVRGRGRRPAVRYARGLAVEFGREWRRVLAAEGDLWLVIGDRHDGQEWIGMDGLVTDWFRRTGWSLHAKGLWAEHPSKARWDDRVNYLLRLKKAGRLSLPPKATLCWRLPLPSTPRGSLWDATPPRVIRVLLKLSPAGVVLDPFFGSGTVGVVATRMGRSWIGVERDPGQARVAARRLGLRRIVSRAS